MKPVYIGRNTTCTRFRERKKERGDVQRELANHVIIYSISTFQTWQEIKEELLHVRQQYLIHEPHIRPGLCLPVQYGRAVGALVFLILGVLTFRAPHVEELVFASPEWRARWQAIPESYQDEKTLLFKRKDGELTDFKEAYQSDHVLYCLKALGNRPESQE